jgi:hypothetical protein
MADHQHFHDGQPSSGLLAAAIGHGQQRPDLLANGGQCASAASATSSAGAFWTGGGYLGSGTVSDQVKFAFSNFYKLLTSNNKFQCPQNPQFGQTQSTLNTHHTQPPTHQLDSQQQLYNQQHSNVNYLVAAVVASSAHPNPSSECGSLASVYQSGFFKFALYRSSTVFETYTYLLIIGVLTFLSLFLCVFRL